VNLLIRRCFEPDSIALMKPAAVFGAFDLGGIAGEEEGEEEEEGEGEGADGEADDEL
jgi:hypothetical protein